MNAGPATGTSWPASAAAASRSTFAQTLGGQQTPLDLSEFPSLGAPSQQQNAPAAQNLWANAPIRSAVSQPQSGGQRSGATSANQQNAQDDVSRFLANQDAYRFGNQLAGLAQTTSQNPQNQGGGDEFPPLGGLGVSHVDQRGGGLLSGFGGQSGLNLSSSHLSPDHATELALRAGMGDRNPTPRGRTLTNPNPFPLPESSQTIGMGVGLSSSLAGAFGSTAGPVGYRNRNGLPDSALSGLSSDLSPFPPGEQLSLTSPSPVRARQSGIVKKRLSEMSTREREGLLGLAAKLEPEHPDFSPLATGQDLLQLGLNLNRPDSTPLYSTFATPFSLPGQNTTPLAIPDYTTPAAYKVQNVPPLHSKIGNMSDEALLAVFYTMTRDIAQELAAQELYGREWRWHTKYRIWLSKDQQMPNPVRLSTKEERGTYIVFNVSHWRKERREMILNYDELEQRHGTAATVQPGFS